MYCPLSNRTGDSVREASPSPFLDGSTLMPEDYIEERETDQGRTPRILSNNEDVVLENKRVLYILDLESKVESFHAELTNVHMKVRLLKEHRQNLANKNSLLGICLQYEEKKLRRDRVMNRQLVEEIQRLRTNIEGASGMHATANAWGFQSIWPHQDLIVNSEGAPSASDSEVSSSVSSSDVKLEEASPSTHRPVKRAKHTP